MYEIAILSGTKFEGWPKLVIIFTMFSYSPLYEVIYKILQDSFRTGLSVLGGRVCEVWVGVCGGDCVCVSV